MDQDLTNKPKNFPLGFYDCFVLFPVEKNNFYYIAKFATIHDVDWNFRINSTESDTTNKIIFTLYPINQPESLYTIDLDVCVVVDNLESPNYNIKVQERYVFSGDNQELKMEIPDYDKIIDWKQGYFDDKKSVKKFKVRVFFVVKAVRMCDSVELLDFYRFDPTIHDIEVNVMGHTMFLSKKLIALQSSYMANLVETQTISYQDLPSDSSFDYFYMFLQVLHGVDVSLNNQNLPPFIHMANHLRVPRLIEYCKKQMILGVHGMTTTQIINMAEKEEFWDVPARKLQEASCVAELKAQNWDLSAIDDNCVKMLTRRIFELKS